MGLKFLSIAIVLFLVHKSQSGGNTPGVQCVTDIAFTIIAEVFNNPVDIGVRLYCPKGHHCVSNSESPCHPNYVPPPPTAATTTRKPKTTTTSIEDTTRLPTPHPTATFLGDINCDGPGYHAAPKCNEYYECAPLFKWFKPVLGTCKDGYFFSKVNKPCSMPPNVVCTDVAA